VRRKTPRQAPASSGQGFTLVEVMVVIAIIVLMMAILLPVVGHARKKAKEAQVFNDFQAIANALEGFKRDFGYYPPRPNPTRPIPSDPSRHNVYIWYCLEKCDLNLNDKTDPNEEKLIAQGRVYLDFPEDRFDSSHRLLDPWGTPYGLLLPAKASGWDPSIGEDVWPKPYRIWSCGPNKTTDSSSPGMDSIDDYNNGGW